MKREGIIKEEMMVVSGDGTKLRFRKDVVDDPRALIVIAHGLCEHLNRYDYFTEKLNENGYSVYRYDQRGHGKSEGKKVYFSDYNEMPEDLAAIVAIAKGESNGKKYSCSDTVWEERLLLSMGQSILGLWMVS